MSILTLASGGLLLISVLIVFAEFFLALVIYPIKIGRSYYEVVASNFIFVLIG